MKETLDQPCDVILVVEDGKQFKAHRNVLSEASPFFEKLLNSDMKESKEGIIRLEMFSESVMAATLEFIYSGHVHILTEDNARDLIVMADYLFLEKLKILAEGVLIQRLNVSTCFSNYYFSERHRCEELSFKTRKFILANFSAVYSANRTEVLNMSSREIEMLISSDEIDVSAEEEVFNVILSWIDHDKSEPKKYFAELFRHVRLLYISRDFLCSDVVTNDLVTGSEGCFDLVEDAMKLIESRDFSKLFIKPRNSLETSCIVINRDGNILCYFPRENKWCHLCKSHTFKRRESVTKTKGFVSCRGKLHGILESLRPENGGDSWSFERHLVRYESFLDKWMLLPYTGKKYTHLEQIFVSKQDELYALVTEPCMHRVSYWGGSLGMELCGKEKHVLLITKYKHETNSWEDISSLDHLDRCNICIVATDDFIYFIGGEGWDYNVPRNFQANVVRYFRPWTDVHRYDLRKNQWSKAADIHERYKYRSGAVVNKNIFILGQLEKKFSQSFHCEVYDETTNEWQVIASPQSGVGSERYIYNNLLAVDGKLYSVMQSSKNVSVYSYDPAQDKWNYETEMTLYYGIRLTNICSMRIYKAFLADHQLQRFVPRSITPSSSLSSFFEPTSTSSTSSDRYKCFIV